MERDSCVELQRITADKPFQCLVLFATGRKNTVELHHQQQRQSPGVSPFPVSEKRSINEELAATGFAIVDRKAEAAAAELLEKLKAAEQEARKQHLNAWQHGDIDADSDEENSRIRRKGKKK